MSLMSRASRLPLRIRLTLILVLLVAGVATVEGVLSYRLLTRNLERDALESLDSATHAVAADVSRALDFKEDRVRSELKSIELGCGVSGIMSPACVRDSLRKLIRVDHARGAVLTFGKRGRLSSGKVTPVNPADAPIKNFEFKLDDQNNPYYTVSANDKESGLTLTADFRADDLLSAGAGQSVAAGVVAGQEFRAAEVDGELDSLEFAFQSGLMRRCFQQMASSATLWNDNNELYYVAFEPVEKASNVCAIAGMPQARVLAPAKNWRTRLKTIVLTAGVCGLVVAYLVALLFTRPLTKLQKRIVKLRQGDYESPVPRVGSGEVFELSEALGQMAESINSSRAALVDSENRLKLAYKAARLWMWEHNLATGIIHWRSPEEGAKPHPGTFRTLLRSVHPEDRRIVCNAVRGAKLTSTYEAEYRVIEKDGTITWISSWGRVVESRRGKPRTMVGVSLDTTGRKQTEALVIEQKKLTATAEISATLAHEINNPLTSVIGAIYMARSTAGVPPEGQRYLQIAQDEARRVAQIARQLLSLYRKPGTAEIVDLRFLWEDVLASRATEANKKGLNVQSQLESVKVFGFRDELRHAFASLLLNAVESAPVGGTIMVRVRNARSLARAGERGARVVIADNGPGIPGEKLPVIFEPFTGTKNIAGAGLGLWATRAAVLKHGGTVRLRTVTTGRTGTCVSLFLPARCASATAVSA